MPRDVGQALQHHGSPASARGLNGNLVSASTRRPYGSPASARPTDRHSASATPPNGIPTRMRPPTGNQPSVRHPNTSPATLTPSLMRPLDTHLFDAGPLDSRPAVKSLSPLNATPPVASPPAVRVRVRSLPAVRAKVRSLPAVRAKVRRSPPEDLQHHLNQKDNGLMRVYPLNPHSFHLSLT